MKNWRSSLNKEDDIQQLARFAKALGHPTRLVILRYLENNTSCVTGDLVNILPIAQSTVSQHLKELREAGLIQGGVNAPKIQYCINQENWAKAKTLFFDFFEINFK